MINNSKKIRGINMKKIMIFLVVVSMLFIAACSNETATTSDDKETLKTEEKMETKTTVSGVPSSFIKANAELTCAMVENPNILDENVLKNLETVAKENGYTLEQLQAESEQYKENQEVAMAILNEMEEICPETVQMIKEQQQGN